MILVKYVGEDNDYMYVGENINIQFHTYSLTYYFTNIQVFRQHSFSATSSPNTRIALILACDQRKKPFFIENLFEIKKTYSNFCATTITDDQVAD